MLYQAFDIVTIFISIIIGLVNVQRIKYESVYMIYLFFFFIYIIPLILDYTLGFPAYLFQWDAIYDSYNKYAGFINSYKDSTTRIVYDIFLLLVQFILLSSKPSKQYLCIIHNSKESNGSINNKMFRILFIASLLPILFSFLAGYYYIPFLYGWRENPLLSSVQLGNYYSTIEKFTYIGIAASLICLMTPNRNVPFKVLMLFICYMNISIESKRSIVFFTIAIFLLLKYKGFGRKVNFVQLGLVAVLCIFGMIVYSLYIKSNVRGYSDMDQLYTNIRIDMFRDDTARLVIYSLFSSIKPVIEWPFQSYLTQIMYFFPLDIINGLLRLDIPMIGFNTYLTSALVGVPISEGERWMTTSMIDENIANFSILACLIIPIVLKKISRVVDRSETIVQILILSALLLSFMYSFNYIVYFLQFVFIVSKIQNK